MSSMVDTVTHEVTALVTSNGLMDAQRVTFSYDPADPYIATLRVEIGEQQVRFDMPREQLQEGLDRDVVAGDLLVSSDAGALTITPAASGSTLRLECARQGVAEFLRATFERVPAGLETGSLDVDQLIEELLSPAS